MTYAEAVEALKARIAQSPAPNPDNKPFLLLHPQKTERSLLMVHGLTDSPHSMRDLARIFHARGYNVAAVLLPGHGTCAQDLMRVTLKEWRDEVALGFAAASALGEEISLAGYSTGGALVLDALARNYRAAAPAAISDVLLFTPALRLVAAKRVRFACLPGVEQVLKTVWPWALDTQGDAHRYAKTALCAVCRLRELIRDNDAARPELLSAIAAHGTGVFAAATAADTAIDSRAVADFMDSLPPKTRQSFLLYSEAEGITHEALTRPELNPLYARLEAALLAFIDDSNRS